MLYLNLASWILVHHFGLDRNISTIIGLIGMKFGAAIHGRERTNPDDFGAPLTFPLEPPTGWPLWFTVKCLNNYSVDCHEIWAHSGWIIKRLVYFSSSAIIRGPILQFMNKYFQKEERKRRNRLSVWNSNSTTRSAKCERHNSHFFSNAKEPLYCFHNHHHSHQVHVNLVYLVVFKSYTKTCRMQHLCTSYNTSQIDNI